jgi:hypothetical protein
MAIDARIRAALLAALVTLAGCATDAKPDLATFLERRATCDHLRGEIPDPPDAARMREIGQQTAQYCTGTDAQLAALKKRYRDDPVVSKQLADFEPRIEAK